MARPIDADYLIARLDKCDPLNGIGLEPVMAIRDIKALISVMPTMENSIQECCMNCPNHPVNGGTGVCACTSPYVVR